MAPGQPYAEAPYANRACEVPFDVLIRRQGALQDGVSTLHGARCAWAQDVQVSGQRAGPHRRHRGYHTRGVPPGIAPGGVRNLAC